MSQNALARLAQRSEGATGVIYVHNFFVTLGAGATQDILVRTPATGKTWLQRYVTAEAQTINPTFEAPTVTLDGTPGVFLSVDRSASRVARTLVFEGPTISATGLGIDNEINVLGVALQREMVWFRLAQATDYLIRTSSTPAGNDVVMSVRITEENE